MTKIGVISDTHIPTAAKTIPENLLERLEDKDMIIHAGDHEIKSALKTLQKLGEVVAVRGNMDRFRDLPRKMVLDIEGISIGVMHGDGPPHGLQDRIRMEFKEVDCIVYGHTHSPQNEVVDDILMFNPGSPTDKRWAPYNSFGVLDVSKGSGVRGMIVRL